MTEVSQDHAGATEMLQSNTSDPKLLVELFLYRRWAREWRVMANCLNRGIERYLYEGEQEEILLSLRIEYKRLLEQSNEEAKSLKGGHNG